MTKRCCEALLVVALLLAAPPCLASKYQWTVEHFKLMKLGLILGDEARTVELKSGWACEISALPTGVPYEGRTTTCKKKGEQFRFVVQCDAEQSKDHVFIGLGSDSDPDYIRVSCKPKT